MKKTFSILVMLMMISSVVLAGGATGPSETTKSSKMAIVKSGEGVKVFYKPSEKGRVKVTIYNNANNKIVFSEEVRSRLGFIRPYNLSDLPEGEYRVVMQDESETREELVSTIKETVKTLVGIIKANENQFAVTFYCKSQNDVTVKVLDSEKNILFSEEFNIEGRDIKLFNLKNLKGATQVEVSGNDGIIKSVTL